MKRIKQAVVALALVVGVGILAAPATVGAVNVFEACPATPTANDSAVCKSKGDDIKTIIGPVVNTLLFLVGIVSVIVIIIGGIMYTVSGGDTGGVTKAKNTILYAVIGLAVAFMAYAIVNWVLGVFNAPPSAQQTCEQSGGTYNAKTKVCKP